jgi:hypothetical protein
MFFIRNKRLSLCIILGVVSDNDTLTGLRDFIGIAYFE